MKDLKDIIVEKLIINKNTKITKFGNKEYLISTENWPRSRVAIIVDIIKNYKKKNRKSFSDDQLKFINKLQYSLDYYWQMHSNIGDDLIALINGEYPEFKNLKVIYDAIIWTLDSDNSCTIPRRKKLENILKELKPYEDEIKELEY